MPFCFAPCLTGFVLLKPAVAASIHLYEMTGHLSLSKDKSDIPPPPHKGQKKQAKSINAQLQYDQSNHWDINPIFINLVSVGPVGIEPTTHRLKVCCSTD